MSFTNTTKSDFNIIDCNGELISVIKPQEKVSIRSAAQTMNDKNYSPQVKTQGCFIKVMIVDERSLIENLMQYPKTYVAWGILRLHISSDNRIMKRTDKGNDRYKVVDLAKEMKISKQAAFLHIKKLKELNAISECTFDKKKYLVANPYCCQKGITIPMKILNLFETTKATFRNDKTCDIPDGDSKNVNGD